MLHLTNCWKVVFSVMIFLSVTLTEKQRYCEMRYEISSERRGLYAWCSLFDDYVVDVARHLAALCIRLFFISHVSIYCKFGGAFH